MFLLKTMQSWSLQKCWTMIIWIQLFNEIQVISKSKINLEVFVCIWAAALSNVITSRDFITECLKHRTIEALFHLQHNATTMGNAQNLSDEIFKIVQKPFLTDFWKLFSWKSHISSTLVLLAKNFESKQMFYFLRCSGFDHELL